MSEGRRRVLLVGFEAADQDLLHRWMDAGELPALRALAGRGATGELPAEAPFMSEGTWQTALTGCGVGAHGLYNWRVVPPGSDQRVGLFRGSYRLPFWRVLREHGPAGQAGTILLDVPYLDPGPPDEGVSQIVGWGLRGHRQIAAADDVAGLVDAGRRPPRWVDTEFDRNVFSEWRYSRILRRNARARCDLALAMLESREWSLAGVNFVETHRAGHAFFHGADESHWAHERRRSRRTGAAMLGVYQAVDEGLGRLVEAVGEDTDVVALSTFSMRPNEISPQLVDEVMVALGYQVPASPDARTRRRLAARTFVLSAVPRVVRHRLRRLVSESTVDEVSRAAWTANIDWARSRMVSEADQGTSWLRVNLEGREPAGIVPARERDRLLAEVEEDLRRLRGPDGAVVIEDVVRVADVAPGPRADALPDLIVVWKPGPHRRLRHPRAGGIAARRETIVPSEHRGLGTIAAAGPHVRPGPVEGRLVDVAPTLLQMLGSPVPEEMEGRPLASMLRDCGEPEIRSIPLARDALS